MSRFRVRRRSVAAYPPVHGSGHYRRSDVDEVLGRPPGSLNTRALVVLVEDRL
jgi:hypothetical protein